MAFLSVTPTAGSLDDILNGGTSLITWVVSAMKALVDFVVSNPIVMVMFYVLLVSFAAGLIMRLIRGIGV